MFVVVLFVIGLLGSSESKKSNFPKELQRCKKNDPAVNECLRKAIQDGLVHLSKGFPKAGLIPIDPLEPKEMIIEQTFGVVKGKVTMNDLRVLGYGNGTILKVESDFTKNRLTMQGIWPHVSMKGKYVLEANVLNLPIRGSGTIGMTYENINAILTLISDGLSTRSGEEYLNLKGTQLQFDIDKLTFDLSNLFDGDKRLGQHANWFLNRYSNQIFKEVKPLVEDSMGNLIYRIAKSFYDKVPYSEIYE